jgi:hypothetical protein
MADLDVRDIGVHGIPKSRLTMLQEYWKSTTSSKSDLKKSNDT